MIRCFESTYSNYFRYYFAIIQSFILKGVLRGNLSSYIFVKNHIILCTKIESPSSPANKSIDISRSYSGSSRATTQSVRYCWYTTKETILLWGNGSKQKETSHCQTWSSLGLVSGIRTIMIKKYLLLALTILLAVLWVNASAGNHQMLAKVIMLIGILCFRKQFCTLSQSGDH